MKTFSCLGLVLCCALLGSAQERVIDKAEFDAMLNAGYGHKIKWKGEKYRMTITASSTVVARPETDYSSKHINEFGPSMETRSIYASVFGGKEARSYELLRIGKWLYSRFGNQPWTRKEYVAENAGSELNAENPRKILSSQTEYKYLGHGTMLDKPVQIYLKTERQTTFNEKNGETAEGDSKHTYWVDEKGTVLKSEFQSEHRGKITIRNSVMVEWTLDPSITFTIPEIVP